MGRKRRQTSTPDTPRAKRAACLRWRVIVMAKEPVMGRVKTRLGRDIGAAHATRFFRTTAAAVLGRIGRDPRFETILCVAPDTAVASPAFPAHLARMTQGGGDLGARLQRAADRAPPGPVIIIGLDIPSITADLLVAAFRTLGSSDAVFGPAPDGGYWLIGFKRFPTTLKPFAHVRWSSAHALADTVAGLANQRVARVATLSDVDAADDLKRLAPHIGRRILPAKTN